MKRELLSRRDEISGFWMVALSGGTGAIAAAMVGGSTLVRLGAAAGGGLLAAASASFASWLRRRSHRS